MSKSEQVLSLDPPNELKFKGPFTDVITANLDLNNPSDKRVCFKVKTTAPKRYCVRPNSGIIEPGSKISVSVMLQPFDYDPNEKNKHKFMVQTMFAPDGPIENTDMLWKEADPEQLMDSKLKCVFEPGSPRPNNVPVKLEEAQTGPGPMEADLKKTMEECRRLTTEISTLKEENEILREESLRLRKLAMSKTTSSTPETTSFQSAVVEQPMSSSTLPSLLIVVIAVILGLVIGKLIL
ncbi:Vesicle-associated membrane protein-associated protein A [Lamellibrachia satsuma]|nr:Vesicle-associated membrane protein-associated protein A [Lamellibrachia satsuma]